MGFLRRKSVAAADADEVRPRNRLSKPMTNRSPVSQRSTSTKHSPMTGSQAGSMSSRTTLEETTGTLSRQESGTQGSPRRFETKEEVKPKFNVTGSPKKTAVASLVMQFENAASSSQLSLSSPIVVNKPLPSTTSLKRLNELQQQRVHSISSKDQLKSFTNSKSTLVSPTASLEQLIDPFAIPRRRESRYRPGDATRKTDVGNEEHQSLFGSGKPSLDLNKVLPQPHDEDKTSYQQDEWTPPPPSIGRTDTPTSLDQKAIGGLRLGSLHIVNGRASPVLSELSKHLISRQLRDVSSEYADSTYSKDIASEGWEDENIVDDVEEAGIESPRTPTRSSFKPDDKSPITPPGKACSSEEEILTPLHPDVRTPDRTSMMAQAYMSELRGSPFSQGSISPVSTSSIQHTLDGHEEVSSLEMDASELQPRTEDLDRVQQACGSPLLSSGSVIHHQIKGDLRSSHDSYERDVGKRKQSFESAQPSIQTDLSVPETAGSRDQAFSSALEFQPPTFRPPPSPERMVSPDSLRPELPEKHYAKVDSGYNSGNSMLSLNLNETKVLPKQLPLTVNTAQFEKQLKAESSKSTPPKKAGSPLRLGRFFPIRPVMHKSPATAPVVPTIETLRPQSFSSTTNIPVKAIQNGQPLGKTEKVKEKEEKQSKMHKKLHKAKPQSKTKGSKDIVVQRLASCESTLDIPAIPETTKANLQLRSQQVPELERTFKSQDHIKNQPSMATLMASPVDIRFPSPTPNSDDEDQSERRGRKDRERSKSRPRSKSRRRSFLDMFKSDKDSGKREANNVKEVNDLSIADFGDVIASLGANPYDIAQSRPQSSDSPARQASGPRTNPHDVSTNRPRKRLSMNDEEASEFARRRSISVNGNDAKNERRSLFDDRGGVKYVRTSMMADDVPPMPPLPNKDELRRISQRYSQQSSQLGTPASAEKVWREMSSPDRQPESSPAPRPPAHSPQPSFVNRYHEQEYPVEDTLELAPPPPSHSPAPVDIYGPPPPSHSPRPPDQDGDTWEQQAQAWKAKRLSATEALRSHRQSLDLEADGWTYGHIDALEYGDESSYPVIPPRHPGRQSYVQQDPQRWDANAGYYYQPDHSQHIGHGQVGKTGRGYSYDDRHYSHQAQMSFQPRYHQQMTWEESQDYVSNGTPSQMSYRDPYGSRQSNQRSMTSLDSRQSFYSHHNCPIDRPFDPPPRVSHDYDNDYGYNNEYYTPQVSPARGRRQAHHDYDRIYNGYEGDYEPAYPNGHGPGYYTQDQHYMGHGPISSKRRTPSQHRHDRQHTSRSRSPHPSQSRQSHRSPAPRSPAASRPTSRHSRRSFHSNASAASLAEELHPEIQKRPSAAPDFGRYSGGMGFGYERETGFGGSAGTRSVSGKADATFKGMPLRESHGVDLGDVPVIGIVKKIR